MKKKYLSILAAGLLSLGTASLANATPLDLSTFTADGDVTVSGGTVTIDETSGLWSSYFYDDFFSVGADALSLSVDYSLSSGMDDVDWLVAIIDDGSNYFYDLEITGNNSGTYTLDLTPYQNSTISLSFGLEADFSDWDYGSVATFSNFDLVSDAAPVPEPGTMVLFGTGLAGLVGASRKKKLNVT